ncbi:MAG: ABC transporter ATP-binding protein [Candidatus Moranbacteria bacterium]|nr:ABC transporter ATP-binding protein [Candidatus Moranbacteria bacterium]
MGESHQFIPIRNEVVRRRETKLPRPLTADERGEDDGKPEEMSLTDHWKTLRLSVQEKSSERTDGTILPENVKLLNELITPELMEGYRAILREFNVRANKTEEHPEREFIDTEEDGIVGKIDAWTDALLREVGEKCEVGLDESDIEELRVQCRLLFDSFGNVMNTNSLERDISDSLGTAEGGSAGDAEVARLVEKLRRKYPFEPDEMELLVDLVRSEKGRDNEYSMRILAETVSRLWTEYGLDRKHGDMAKISLGYLAAKGAESFAPSLFQGIMANGMFDAAVFIEYLGLEKLSEVISTKNDIELAKVMVDVNRQINRRITDSLFFQEFEFIHDKSLGEVYAALERGKESSEQMLREVVSQFAPSLSGIVMSLAFLTKINPILGGIGVGSLPVMYAIAKKQNDQIWPMYERERREGEKIATRLDAVKRGFEEVKTLANVAGIASNVREQMDAMDSLALQRFIEERKMSMIRRIPFDVSSVIAAGVGGALQRAGMISGGAILSNIMYSGQLNWPVKELVELYFNRFSRYVQDIRRLDEILGKYETLDLPDGEREGDRVPVSDLPNLDISIKDLRYRDILRGVDLDVKQGEFVVIAGASGAGKSTLLRNLTGLYRPDGGEVTIGGVRNDRVKRFGKESVYSVMSYCNQSPQYFEGMTLRENLTLWSGNEADDAAVRRILSDLRLDALSDRLDEEVKHLSGGERVRIGVARTLIKDAKILLFDEPTASLDSQAAAEVRRILTEIREKYPEKTVICVSHDEELIRSSPRAVRLEDLQRS